MELVSGFLLWVGDVFGVKWVRREDNIFKKVVKAATFMFAGIVFVILSFVLFN